MIPVAWCGSIDRRSGRRRSKFLYRRVDARVACSTLFDLDALHFLKDAEELRSALRENYEQDREKLILRLSTRQKKKRRKGKELPLRQRLLLSNFPSDIVSLKGKQKTGFDLLQTLKEMWEIFMTYVDSIVIGCRC